MLSKTATEARFLENNSDATRRLSVSLEVLASVAWRSRVVHTADALCINQNLFSISQHLSRMNYQML